MAEIENPVEFSKELKDIVDLKLADPTFSYEDWSADDLQKVRTYVRNYYRKAQKGWCAYCRNVVSLSSTGNCHVEHIAPKSLYRPFMFEPKNLCVICADCNEIKRNQETIGDVPDTVKNGATRKKYPTTSNGFKIVHPHFDIYDEHILILRSGFYLDKSKKGHFTIGSCRLNRRLYEFGWEKELVDDAELSEMMTEYLSTEQHIKKSEILDSIRKMLLEV